MFMEVDLRYRTGRQKDNEWDLQKSYIKHDTWTDREVTLKDDEFHKDVGVKTGIRKGGTL